MKAGTSLIRLTKRNYTLQQNYLYTIINTSIRMERATNAANILQSWLLLQCRTFP
jgi:hypothetical protein